MAIRISRDSWEGVSTQGKPINARIGENFYELDTGKSFIYKGGQRWEEKGTGGSGGPTPPVGTNPVFTTLGVTGQSTLGKTTINGGATTDVLAVTGGATIGGSLDVKGGGTFNSLRAIRPVNKNNSVPSKKSVHLFAELFLNTVI